MPDPNLGTSRSDELLDAEPISMAKPPQCHTNSPKEPKEIVRDVR